MEEDDGLVSECGEVLRRGRTPFQKIGKSLKPILDAMWSWGEDYKEKCNK